MNTIVQRVTRASVTVDAAVVGEIGHGAVLLVGIEEDDTEADAVATAEKIAKLRFFPGATPMDKNLAQVEGACLVISQFTLAAILKKGNRPSFNHAMDPEQAVHLYERLVARLAELGIPTATGEFGASMSVDLVNHGPITFSVACRDGKIQ